MDDELKLDRGGFYFSWDDRKAALNVRKHRVSFEMAAEVFFDENAYVMPDTTTDEERYRIVGKAETEPQPILFVVYVERYTEEYKQMYRLISARHATQREVRQYER